jgi:Protein of unknown function (DUF2800)
VTFLPADSIERWLHCGGSAALEETEAPPTESIAPDLPLLRERYAALEARGAKVQTARGVRVDIGVITGERAASALIQGLLIAEWDDHSRIEVYGHSEAETPLLTLAALIKYSLLHEFTETGVASVDELYAAGQKITEAGALALSLRGEVTALSHLTPGPHCKACRAAYRCPALATEVHEEVFGEIQALDEPNLTPVPPRVRLGPGEELPALIAAALERIPLIESWITSVRAQAELLELLPRSSRALQPRRPRKKRRKKSKRLARISPPPPT